MTAAAAAPNRISIGGAGTSWPPEVVVVEPPEVEELDEELELLDEELLLDPLVDEDELDDEDEEPPEVE